VKGEVVQLTTRKQRTVAFREFSDQSTDLFNTFWDGISLKKDLKQLNDLVICPKGAMGGLSNNLVEVFFGMKYHSWSKHVGENFNVTDKANVIYGARLEYRLTDNGNVYVILTPSQTDSFKPLEDGILLDVVHEPRKLENKSKKHWMFLLSYMKVTDVDGQANIFDIFMVGYLRGTKRYFKNEKSQTRKIQNWFSFVAKWVVSVGLSGLIIFLTTLYLSQRTEDKTITELSEISLQLRENNILTDKLVTYLSEVNLRLSELNVNQIEMLNNQLSSEEFLSSLEAKSQALNAANGKRNNELLGAINQIQTIMAKEESSE
jgi:hypothetical protein